MYKLNEKVFNSASEALDHYIRDFQMCNDYTNVETSRAKSTRKEYRLDKLEDIMSTRVRAPLFNNLINNSEVNSLGNLTSSTENSSCLTENKRDERSFEAINQVERLIHNLSTKVEDYKSDSSSLSFSKLKPDVSFSSSSSSSYKDFSSSTSNRIVDETENTVKKTEESDPIIRSIMKFEDLNKQLSSSHMFTKVQSSIPVNDNNVHKTVLKPIADKTVPSLPKPFSPTPVIQTTISQSQSLTKSPSIVQTKLKSPIPNETVAKSGNTVSPGLIPTQKHLFTPVKTLFEVKTRTTPTPENKLTAYLEVGPNSVNFVNECIKIIEGI